MPELNEIAGIVLAAGESKRYGEENKLLLPVQDQSVIQQTLTSALESSLKTVLLVVGYDSARLCESLGAAHSHSKLKILQNHSWQRGKASSIRCALSALPASTKGALFLLADMPLMTPHLINQVIEGFMKTGMITFPTVNGEKGHPIIWPQERWEELTSLEGDSSAMDLVKQYWETAEKIELSTDQLNTQWDVDTPEAYQKVIDLLENQA